MRTPKTLHEIPLMVPEPRELEFLEGETTLSEDVRLVTSNVLPLFRKSMRTALSETGIRVVANKKRFIVEARIEKAEALDLSRVPEEVYSEFYEIRIEGNHALIRAMDQPGVLWAACTLGAILRFGLRRGNLPNLRVRDWPGMHDRGIFVESKWGPDRMTKDDWCRLLDRMASLKMNRLGIGLYGCWCCQYEGKITEFLMVPVPDHPEIHTEKTIKYYSPNEGGEWIEETYLPKMFEEDFLGDVVAYAKEKGISVIPFVNSLGHNTLFPRMLPEISAKDEDGKPVGAGYCLSTPETRAFIEAFYGSIIDRYFPDGCPYFHIQMDEVYSTRADVSDPARALDPWCRCEQCRAKSREELLQEYIVWLVQTLVNKGVDKVVIWNDQLTRHMDVLDAGFAERLEKAGLKEHLVIHWWWYSNAALSPAVDPALGTKLGIEGWVGPMTCYFNWSRYSTRLRNIEMMMELGWRRGARGAMAYSVHDPGWADHEALLASYAWNCRSMGPLHRALPHWAEFMLGDKALLYTEARDALEQAAENPAVAACWYYPYTYYAEGRPFPRHYPEEPLEHLGKDSETALENLKQSESLAARAAELFAKILEGREGMHARTLEVFESLLAESERTRALAAVFACLLEVRRQAAAGKIEDQAGDSVAAARERLVQAMTACEKNKPRWVVPAVLRDLSVLLQFLDQLAKDLGEAAAGKREAAGIRWHVEPPINQEDWPAPIAGE